MNRLPKGVPFPLVEVEEEEYARRAEQAYAALRAGRGRKSVPLPCTGPMAPGCPCCVGPFRAILIFRRDGTRPRASEAPRLKDVPLPPA